MQCLLGCQVEKTVAPRTKSSRCKKTSCAVVYIYTVLQQDHMARAATAFRILCNQSHRYLSSPAHPDLIYKLNNTECAKIRRKCVNRCDNTNDERFIVADTLS